MLLFIWSVEHIKSIKMYRIASLVLDFAVVELHNLYGAYTACMACFAFTLCR